MRTLLILATILVVCTSSLQAAELQNVSIEPSSFFFTAGPGDERKNYVSVENNSDKQQKITLESIAVEVSDSYGHIKRTDENKWSLTDWVQFKETVYIIEPNSSAFIPFTIQVPEDAEKGSYSGAVVAKTETGKTTIIKGTVLYVNVGLQGKTTIELADFIPERNRLSLSVKNTGVHRTQTYGRVTWYSMFGQKTQEQKIDNIIVSPNQFVTIFIPYPNRIPGIYKAQVDVLYINGNQHLQESKWVIQLPPEGPLLGGILIAVGFVIYRFRKKEHATKKK